MDKFKKLIKNYLLEHDIDAIGAGVIDFSKNEFEDLVFFKEEKGKVLEDKEIFFDLASVTKVLTNGVLYLLNESQMTEKHRLLVEHRAGLPAWGLLSKSAWKEEVSKYEIKAAETLYSDYSALRFMLEWEKTIGVRALDKLRPFYDTELKWWQELDSLDKTVQNGFEGKEKNFTYVHDPNARNIKEFTSHAGLFSTVRGLAKTLLTINKELDLLNKILKNKESNRFVLGWDTVEKNTLAGKGCSDSTFGHLGFTGTSVWIDPERKRGSILLTNSTKNYWFDRKNLNQLRRDFGALVWQ